MYNSDVKHIRRSTVPFTEVRQNLTAILDDVENSGKPVTILRRGKPAAVIISHHEFQSRIAGRKQRFQVAGSIKIAPGVDIGNVLAKAKQERIQLWKSRTKRSKDTNR
jgi:prevent-host-death family protein